MKNLKYDADKFCYKIQQWGSLNPSVKYVIFTDHTVESTGNSAYDYTVVALVQSCLDLTRKPNWIDYFGRSKQYKMTEKKENHSIGVTYENGTLVKFELFESNLPQNESSKKHAKVLVDKRL